MKYKLLLSMMAISIGITGCSSATTTNETTSTEATTEQVSEETTKEETTQEESTQSENNEEQFVIKYPESLQEKFGTELVLEKRPERIICMTAGPVQTLYEMGVEMLAIPDSVIDEWAEDLTAKRLPFSMSEIDMEGILALEPDFVVLSTGNKDKYGKILEDNNIPVYYVKAGPFVTMNDIKEEVQIIGEAFGNSEKTNEILARFEQTEQKLAEYKANNEPKDTVVLFGVPASMTLTSGSYLGGILAKMGFNNIADTNELSTMNGSTMSLNMEKLVEVNPEVIVAVSPGVKEKETLEKLFKEDVAKNKSLWDSIDAIKNDDVIYLDSSLSKSSGIKVLDDIDKLLEMLQNN